MLSQRTRRVSRRRFVALTSTAALVPSFVLRAQEKADQPFASFDREMERFMTPRKVPGGAVAVVKDGRLVYAQGYGWADRDRKIKVHADSLFRIASISKPFTAVAVLKLVEQGKLDLEARAFDLLKLKPLPGAKERDARLDKITVRHLLHHTGGWDRDKSFDPMFRSREIATAAGEPSPANAQAVIRYMLGKPLDFDPGTRYAYSNFGFCVLGRIIEQLTGQSYEAFVREQVLVPSGIKTMRVGATLEGKQAPNEVRYYTSDDSSGESVFAEKPGKVLRPYGTFNLEAMDSHGGWLASAVDLCRLAAKLDAPAGKPLLNAASMKIMNEMPAHEAEKKPASFYGCGWMVRPVRGGKANTWHSGSLPGTNTLLVRRWDGLSWAAVFNLRRGDPKLPDGEIDPAMHHAADAVKEWPKHDLFGSFA